MILMSPPIRLGKTTDERRELLRQVAIMDVKTISAGVGDDWTDEELEEARQFLDDHGLRVGEFSAFHKGFDSENAADRESAMDHYRCRLHYGQILGAHCIGFSTYGDRATPGMWSEDTWQRCMAAVGKLARIAEEADMDVAAHPHIMAPLCSIERYTVLIETVASSRLKILMDPVNLTWPHIVYNTTALVNQIFDELGDHITALHAKDVTMSGGSGVRADKGLGVIHVDEAVPGTGYMDYPTILRRLNQLNHDVTIYVEHFDYEDTIEGQEYIRRVAQKHGIPLQ